MDKKPEIIDFSDSDIGKLITMYFTGGTYCKEFGHDYELMQQTKIGWTAVDTKHKCKYCGDQQDQHIELATAQNTQI